ncbi:hypothetical protein [Deinococcus sp.]|uniref:hypothetical protein n=1 Tax=Deinococcus sp. TaxID=47478 RepID=UPI0025BF3F0A|nr:hypothetical protein [Deinococcus sp.]
MTPAFTEVSAYVRMVEASAAQAFVNGGQRPFTAPCDHPAIDISMRPERNTVESCSVRVTALDHIELAAKISNGWLIVSDSQGTRRVKAAEFPDLRP